MEGAPSSGERLSLLYVKAGKPAQVGEKESQVPGGPTPRIGKALDKKSYREEVEFFEDP